MRSERWWWLAGFLILSVLIHIFLALHGPGFGLKGVAPSTKEIELTLEPLPAVKKTVKPQKIAAQPKSQPRAAVKQPAVAKLVSKKEPQVPVAKALPAIKPALTPVTPVSLPEDKPETEASAPAAVPQITRSASLHTGLSGGESGGGITTARGAQAPTEKPTDSGLPGGMHFPKMAARIGGESIMSVNNPLAEDAVPEEKPGSSAGSGRGSGGLDGKMLASLRGGIGSGLGSGKGSGTGRGAGRGTGTGASGSGAGGSAALLAEDSSGGARFALRTASVGGGHHFGTSHSAEGNPFGDVGGLLRGDPARAVGDGKAGGDGHGLSAEIYEGQPYLTKLVGHRADAIIDFNWGMVIPVATGVSRIFSMRWTGEIQPEYSETYTFMTQEDDGLRLWVDGQPLVTDWKDHHLTTQRGSIRLEAGRKYDIRIEYFNGPDHARENTLGHAETHLFWSSPSQRLEIVPESALWQNK
ncbi:MAG: PA14 domain-containing protein [Janthinobacterium lividum]